MKGKATLQWDGQDNDAIALDDDGLCNPDCVDLTDGGTNDGLHVQVIFDDLKCKLTFKVYTGTNWSQYTVNLPGGITEESNRVDVFFPFNGFTVGGGTGAVFTSTGAVVMEIDGTVAAGVDVSIDMMATDSNREYGDLPVGTYGTSILNANHIPKGLRLGNNCDIEATYKSSTGANGDDTNDVDDEDGVAPTNLPWDPGSAGGAVAVTREGCANLGGCYVNGWIDWNGDGDFADTVEGASEHVVNNQLESTDTTETYTFNTPTSYSAGSYYARFRTCQGSADCDNPDTTDTNVTNGEVEDYKWDITSTAVAFIGDYVWEDLNANGIQEAGETGIAGVTVNLYDSGGNFVKTTTTDPSGLYSFTNLIPGDYYVEFVKPNGYSFGPQDRGDNALDSDANLDTGQTEVTTLSAGENDLTWDAGLYQPASIGDFVWLDSDRDGVQEPEVGEIGIEDVTVRLYDSDGNEVDSTTTDENGFYEFVGLMPDSYHLEFVKPSGYYFSPQDQGGDDTKDSDANSATGQTEVTSLTSGEDDLTWDVGLYLMTPPGVGTPGYWKNHPEAWPVQEITIGGVPYAKGSKKDKGSAIWWMSQDDKHDKTITMFRSLVAAKLNVMVGNDSSCIEDVIREADAWMTQYGPVGCGVRASSEAWKLGEPLYLMLDDYNNGRLCAPARD